MKKCPLFILFFFILFIPLTAVAAEYYVKPTGNDTNSGLGTSDSLAWRTIARATTTAGPGDIVNIMAGTYTAGDGSACLRTHASGTSGNPITFQNNGADTVILKNQWAGVAIFHSYITIKGLKIINDSQSAGMEHGIFHWGSALSNIIIDGCTIRNTTTGDPSHGIRLENVSYCIIRNCTIDHIGTAPQPGPESGNGIWLAPGWHCLIEGNTTDYCGHAGLFLGGGGSNIIRNNTFIGTWGVCAEHVGYQSYADNTHQVVEKNVLRRCRMLEDGLWSNPAWEQMGSGMIFRRNRVYDSIGTGIQIYSRTDYESFHNRFYQNVVYDGGKVPPGPYIRAPYELVEDIQNTQGDNIAKNTIHYDFGASTPATYTGMATAADLTISGNTWNGTDPLFSNAPSDLTLQEESPCIDLGEFLTEAKYAGSGNQVVVEDARYFTDGFGLVPGDIVQFQGQAQTAQITAVNYSTHTLTLDQSMSWSIGQGISLAYSGAAPDIGAYEHETGDPESPVASFNASPAEGAAPLQVSLDASPSYDPDGTITSYAWDFGDGTAGSGLFVVHTYQDYGVYAAKLTVTDNNNQTSTASTSIKVEGPPHASFSISPSAGRLPIKVKFDASTSSDPAGRIVSYRWDFGDGKHAGGKIVSHYYSQEGTYTAVLTVRDNDQLENTTSQNVTIVASPIARISGGPKKGRAPNAVNLDASASLSSQQGTKITSYEWNFGDGTHDTLRKVRHVYSSIGIYPVTLKVTDEKNKTKSTTVEIGVYSVPKAIFTCSPVEGIKVSMPVAFDASSSYDNYDQIVSYDWKFGDGTTGSGKNITHVYGKGGRSYTVTLTVTNSQGHKKSASKSLLIKKN